MPEPHQPKRINFDPTINLGHVLTALMMLGAGAAAYSAIATRVSILEERSVTTSTRTRETESEQKEALKEIKGDVKDMQRSINEIIRTLAAKRP